MSKEKSEVLIDRTAMHAELDRFIALCVAEKPSFEDGPGFKLTFHVGFEAIENDDVATVFANVRTARTL